VRSINREIGMIEVLATLVRAPPVSAGPDIMRSLLALVLLVSATTALADESAEPVSPPQETSPSAAVSPPAYRVRGTEMYPTLEDRELGQPFVSPDPEERVWPRALPFLAQRVIDLGFDLPNPYGVALIGARIRQDLVLDGLEVGLGGGELEPIEFVDFGQPRAEQSTVQGKLDAWLFPFMNVYALFGRIDGRAELELAVPGDELLGFLGLGGICNPPIGRPPDICTRTLVAKARPKYQGNNVGVGINLAMGWNRFFVTIPITYVWSDVDLVDTTIEALNISPRIGVTGDVGEMGVIAVFIGATYLDAEVDLTGSATFDTSGVPGLQPSTELDFKISQRNKDEWNWVVGANWDVSKHWSAMVEAGVGGSRENLIAGFTYRW
jgi:hypothetical protein